MLAVSQASGTETARPQCATRSGRSHTATVFAAAVASSPPRACDDEAGGAPDAAVTAPAQSVCDSFRFGVLQAQVFRAVEQLEQLAVLHAVDLVAAAFDLRLAHLVAGRARGGFGLARRLPRRFCGLGAVLEAVR